MIVKERTHHVASSLAPSFLLSMPQLLDPNFKQTVVLLCRHSEEGAFGLVVNRPLTTSGRIVVNLDPPVTTDRELQVWVGGPVEPERSWILVGRSVVGSKGDHTDGIRITDDLLLSTSPDLLRRLFDPTPPADARLILGYSGWGPGQLEAELEASAWLMSDVDRNLIFNTPADRMWETAIRRLGADPSALQISRGVH
jgi:putative transcriptional regulator